MDSAQLSYLIQTYVIGGFTRMLDWIWKNFGYAGLIGFLLGLFVMSNVYKIKQNMWLVVLALILLASAFVYFNIGSTTTYQQFSSQAFNYTYNLTNIT